MQKILYIMVGGGLGAASRHLLFSIIQRTSGLDFPIGTMLINLTGSFLIGIFWNIFSVAKITPEFRLFLFTGLLGGFTTFSTFTRETAQLIKVGEFKEAVIYLTLSNFLGVLLVFGGFYTANYFLQAIRP